MNIRINPMIPTNGMKLRKRSIAPMPAKFLLESKLLNFYSSIKPDLCCVKIKAFVTVLTVTSLKIFLLLTEQ